MGGANSAAQRWKDLGSQIWCPEGWSHLGSQISCPEGYWRLGARRLEPSKKPNMVPRRVEPSRPTEEYLGVGTGPAKGLGLGMVRLATVPLRCWDQSQLSPVTWRCRDQSWHRILRG